MRTQSIKFIKDESAISTVVSAVLFLGIIVSIITVVNVQYVPEWKTTAEQEHMDDVLFDMAEMKNELDMLSVYARTEPSSRLSMSVPVKMGGGSIPVFASGKSGGILAINDDEFDLSILATTPGIAYNSDPELLNLGTVSYFSDNTYFVDQKFTYENGALIVSQNDYSLMRLGPQIDITRTENATNITMDINTIDVDGLKRSVSGSSVEEINFRTNGSDSLYWDGILFTDVTITLKTSYPSSWVTFFETIAYDSGLDSAEYSVSSNDTTVVFFLEGGNDEDIKLNVTKSMFDARLNILS